MTKLTPLTVRDQMIDCFTEMHHCYLDKIKKSSDESTTEQLQELENMNIHEYFRRFFYEIGGNFMEPTKKDLLEVLNRCLSSALKSYPEKEVKTKAEEMQKLINSLK